MQEPIHGNGLIRIGKDYLKNESEIKVSYSNRNCLLHWNNWIYSLMLYSSPLFKWNIFFNWVKWILIHIIKFISDIRPIFFLFILIHTKSNFFNWTQINEARWFTLRRKLKVQLSIWMKLACEVEFLPVRKYWILPEWKMHSFKFFS